MCVTTNSNNKPPTCDMPMTAQTQGVAEQDDRTAKRQQHATQKHGHITSCQYSTLIDGQHSSDACNKQRNAPCIACHPSADHPATPHPQVTH